MSKRWVAILLVAAALLTVLSQVLSHRDSSDWRANRSRRLLPFPWKDAVAFELVRPGGETVTLFRPAGGEWRIALADDLSDLVDLTVVDEMSAFATLAWREPLPRPQPVNPDTALRLTATSVEGQRVEMLFGDAADTLRSVVVDGDDSAVYGIPQDLLKFLEWPADRLRSLRLAAASSGSTPVRIVLDPAGGDEGLRLEMERRPEGWQLVQPLAWPVDESRVDLLLRWFDRLGADAIVAETVEDAAEYGFDADSALVEIELDTLDGRLRRRIRFSQPSAESESVYALVEGRTPLFTVSSHTLEGVFLTDIVDRPKEWRNLYRSRSIDILEGESPDLLVIEQLLPEPAPLRLERLRDQAGIRWRGVLERSGT
ncbi:MAG: DUF4340 domain-containing protein, partial [Planctomycetes bacterium]|nr:DUF4340 domain-containing protein [Planctomycetota bacterium]